MTYSSLIFASVILPISVLFLFFDRSSEYKNFCLCVTSFLFAVWGHHMLSGLIFLTLIADYFLALAVEGSKKNSNGRGIVFLVMDFLLNAAVIVFIGHNDLFPEESGLSIDKLLIPTGAAFYALKNFSYVYDVYTGRCKAEHSPFYFLTYGMSYPFMLAGPVVRYADIAPQLRERKLSAELLSRGIKGFAIGFVKTVVALPILQSIADAGLHAEGAAGLGSVVGMAAWLMAAWFGFTGMSDMGTGIACMNGFDVPLNYKRLNAKHMLGGTIKCYNTSMVQLAEDIRGDGSAAPVLTVVLAVCGAAFYSISPVYLIVGLAAGLVLAGEYLFAYDRIEEFPAPVKAVITLIVAFVLFSPLAFDSVGGWTGWLSGLAKPMGEGGENAVALLKNNIVIVMICLISMSPVGGLIKRSADRLSERSRGHYAAVKVSEAVLTAAAFAVSFILLAGRIAEG